MRTLLAATLGTTILGAASLPAPAHPKLKAAVPALEAARDELVHAQGDLGGHKKDALESINRALKEIRLAIQFEKY